MIEGFFELQTAEDLLRKLQHDLELMKTHPFDIYLAFNFFVTAESMLDWVYPGDKNKNRRNELRNSQGFLKATSDLATGAKHFMLRYFHDTVSKAFVTPGWFANYFPKGAFPPGYFGDGALIVCINGIIEGADPEMLTALSLATEVLYFWESKLGFPRIKTPE